ncbi:unnamed protein product [Lactuca saligna]|uniref:RRM domain-containing protein n=1 Tax=Lactuca saligna TaxID=75948 RepID=A0AA35VY89_LACSI|nr:unnamed protein product [Lactuca saligna]
MVGNESGNRSRTQVGSRQLIEKVSSPFYVTNFPVDFGVKELWDACVKVGIVVDVYIAKKLSKLGKHFAFVRFIKVSDEKLLESKIRDIWLGSYHLFASVARFQQELDYTGLSNSHVHGDQVVSKLNGQGLGSYVTVVMGGKGMHGMKGPKPNVCTLSGKSVLKGFGVCENQGY